MNPLEKSVEGYKSDGVERSMGTYEALGTAVEGGSRGSGRLSGQALSDSPSGGSFASVARDLQIGAPCEHRLLHQPHDALPCNDDVRF